MKTYLVRLTPMEPYFFGNEKTFLFTGDKNRGQRRNNYYIRSERTPLQTTLLGMMRYLFLAHKGFHLDEEYQNENAERVGPESFDIKADNQHFGIIKKISPLFILKGSEKLVVTPFDCLNNQNIRKYTPFSNYHTIQTSRGEKKYTPEYDSKSGITDSYMNTSDGFLTTADDIFLYQDRIGIKKQHKGIKNDKSFFKKQYCFLKEGYDFGFYLTLSDDTIPPAEIQTVYLGQGKSLFTVKFVEEQNTLSSQISPLLSKGTAYCMSDVYTELSIYDFSQFAVTKLRDFRSYSTHTDGKVEKGSELHKLISAGSIFRIADADSFMQTITQKHLNMIGFNTIIISKED